MVRRAVQQAHPAGSGLERLCGRGKLPPWPQSPAASHEVLSSLEPMPMTAAAQGKAKSRLAGIPTRASPSPPNLFCLLCAACPVAPSALTPDPDCNSSSLLTTLFTQWFLSLKVEGSLLPHLPGLSRESCTLLGIQIPGAARTHDCARCNRCGCS